MNFYQAKIIGVSINSIYIPFNQEYDENTGDVNSITDPAYPGSTQEGMDLVMGYFPDYNINVDIPGNLVTYSITATMVNATWDFLRLRLNNGTTTDITFTETNCDNFNRTWDFVTLNGPDSFGNGIYQTEGLNSTYGIEFQTVPAGSIVNYIDIDGQKYTVNISVDDIPTLTSRLNQLAKGTFTVNYTSGTLTILRTTREDFIPNTMGVIYNGISSGEAEIARAFEVLDSAPNEICVDTIQTEDDNCILTDDLYKIIEIADSICCDCCQDTIDLIKDI